MSIIEFITIPKRQLLFPWEQNSLIKRHENTMYLFAKYITKPYTKELNTY